jgi:tetratricopeptide (TPR) repeat protein
MSTNKIFFICIAAFIWFGLLFGETRHRNYVWANEETLWQNVTVQSPNNGRAWMNYGLTQMNKGQYDAALVCFLKAHDKLDSYWPLETNLGIIYGQMGYPGFAEFRFKKAIELASGEADPWFFYGRWLDSAGRKDEAKSALMIAVGIRGKNHQEYPEARELLAQINGK